MNYYTGNITPEPNTIFVFGSNPQGRHGAGAAYTAHIFFKAQYGIGEGLTGNSYALPTKELRGEYSDYAICGKSMCSDKIINNIKKLYECCKQNPDKKFKVAYRNVDNKSLNGYTGIEMMSFFKEAGEYPENIYFSKEWVESGYLN